MSDDRKSRAMERTCVETERDLMGSFRREIKVGRRAPEKGSRCPVA